MQNPNSHQASSQDTELARLMDHARQQGEADVFSGKRRWIRYTLPMRLEVTAHPEDPSAMWPVTMHNISGGGFGFWSKFVIEDGAAILVRETSRSGSAVWLKAHTTHCTIGIRGHLIGAVFDNPSPPDVGDDAPPPASKEGEPAVNRAPRQDARRWSLNSKCATGSALACVLGVGVTSLVYRDLWPRELWTPMIGLSASIAYLFGRVAGWLAVRGELKFLEALRKGIRKIAMREPIPMQLRAAPSRELAALGQAFLDLAATWRKHQEDERLARQKLEELNQIKSNILSIVSHDLRTPLTSILLYAQMLTEELRTLAEEDQRRFLGIISDECTRLSRLVDDLLEVQRLEAGRVQWDMQSRDISETIRACARLFEAMAKSKSMEFTVECPETLPPVEADADKISQVLSNLLSNAMKYTPAGGKVRFSSQVSGKDIMLSVADNGPGIPRDKWDQIFDRFAQLANPNVREIAGCGLGLYIVRQIVERHGGAVWVDSEVGRGSEFFISLPTKASQTAPEKDASTTPSAGRVVVCDADPELAAMIAQTLRLEKFEVRQAHSGCRLLAQLEHGDTDVVVTDVLMPDMNAMELLDGLLSVKSRGIGLVIHSYAGEGRELRGRGVDVYLRRPASKNELLLAVRAALSRRAGDGHGSQLVLLTKSEQMDTKRLRRLLSEAGHTPVVADDMAAAGGLIADFPMRAALICGDCLSGDWRELGELDLKNREKLDVVVLCESLRHHERRLAESLGVRVIACRRGHEEDVVAAVSASLSSRAKEYAI